jgi:alcohol dehydrogenase, propanol-preferring
VTLGHQRDIADDHIAFAIGDTGQDIARSLVFFPQPMWDFPMVCDLASRQAAFAQPADTVSTGISSSQPRLLQGCQQGLVFICVKCQSSLAGFQRQLECHNLSLLLAAENVDLKGCTRQPWSTLCRYPSLPRGLIMRAMVLERQRQPLILKEVEKPVPTASQVLINVTACGICRTDLHVVDADLTEPVLPLIPGHQIVGMVEQVGEGVSDIRPGQRIGIPWLGSSCGHCWYCDHGKENLCDEARYTGYQINGGFAEYAVAEARYCFPIPDQYEDIQAAPLLCAGLIGYRSYRLVEDCQRIGFYGFGAAAHILIQVANHFGQEVYAFSRPGDIQAQQFAMKLGAVWAGDSSEKPPQPLDGAIIFAPAGELVPLALKAVRKGGTVVCAGIHMSDIPSFPYSILWGERSICSVANLTRQDGEDFLPLAAKIPVRTEVTSYPLERANEALEDLRRGQFSGAAVLIP